MKITDKMRLDWLNGNDVDSVQRGSGKWWYVTSLVDKHGWQKTYGSSPRAAIDAAIKAEGKVKR